MRFRPQRSKWQNVPKTAGARPSPKKADATGHRPHVGLVVLPPAPGIRVPPIPRTYSATVRKAWREFWRSPVASAVDRGADMPALLHWAWCLNELDTILPVLSRTRLITGSAGQPALNPLAQYAQQLRSAVQWATVEFGMTSLSRSRLGLTIGQAKLTAQELNRRLANGTESRAVEVWEGEWSDDGT